MNPRSFLLTLILFLCCSAVQAGIGGHALRKLRINVTPNNPSIGDSITVDASFILRSPSGFDDGRFRAFFNGINGRPLSGTYTFGDIDLENKEVSVSFAGATAFQLSQEQTNVTFQYGLTRTNFTPPQASVTKIITALPQTSSGNGGGGGGNNDGGGDDFIADVNGNPISIPQVLFLDVEEATNTDVGMVSEDPKRFRLTVSHNQDYISFVDKELHDPSLDQLLKRLVVRSKDLETNNGDVVTGNFNFALEQGSIADANRENFLATTYISDSVILTNTQRLNFIIDVSNFIERSQIEVPNNLVTKDNVRYKLNPLTVNLSSLTISPNTLDFLQDTANAKKNRQLLVLNDAVINAEFNTGVDISNATITSSKFNKKKRAKIRTTTSAKPRVKINSELRDTVSFTATDSNGNYSVSIPIQSSINTSKKTFISSKTGLSNGQNNLRIIIPTLLNVASGGNNGGLDMIFEGELNTEANINFETLDEVAE